MVTVTELIGLFCFAVVVFQVWREVDRNRRAAVSDCLRRLVCPTCGAGGMRRTSRPKSRGVGYVPVYRCGECCNQFDVPQSHISARVKLSRMKAIDAETDAFLADVSDERPYDS